MNQVCCVLPLCCLFQISYFFGGLKIWAIPNNFSTPDIFAMIQLPVFVFHIGSTERSDIISKWCPKTASTTSQSPRFRMLRNVTESTENTLETTIFHPNNSRQQISQRLETYLRKHNPLTVTNKSLLRLWWFYWIWSNLCCQETRLDLQKLPDLLGAIEDAIGCCQVDDTSLLRQLTSEVQKTKGLRNQWFDWKMMDVQ